MTRADWGPEDAYYRQKALELAVEQEPMSHPDTVLKRAQLYYDFLTGNDDKKTPESDLTDSIQKAAKGGVTFNGPPVNGPGPKDYGYLIGDQAKLL